MSMLLIGCDSHLRACLEQRGSSSFNAYGLMTRILQAPAPAEIADLELGFPFCSGGQHSCEFGAGRTGGAGSQESGDGGQQG